ncbi:MAG TPA: DUF2252 domain-containing protein [Acidimicrobiales bacterium]|nr:DUF2252 domain-containing protein [Acidimicrobiales bacterium]
MPETPRDRERLLGRRLRKVVPRSAHGEWEPPAGRADPLAVLEAENAGRIPALVPVRWGRMLESPFAFLRGAAGVMAGDLASTPTVGVHVQLCGDAHVANFGVFASPERRLLFDVTDFDETTPGPWEWDLKRLATSVVLAAREAEVRAVGQRGAARAAARAYRRHMARFARMGTLEVWYERVDAKAALRAVGRPAAVEHRFAAARQRTSWAALPALTVLEDGGRRRIADHPPLVTHAGTEEHAAALADTLERYRASLEDDRRALLERFELVDVAAKVVGVGSVGTRCFVTLFMSDDREPLFLQVKEARPSAVAPHVPRLRAHARVAAQARRGATQARRSGGRRVVGGQRLMQAASDIFLGWVTTDGTDYYLRQLRDMKGSVDPGRLQARDLADYAELCGWALARAHARSGAAASIAGYAGSGTVLDEAVARFALSYADQTERDHAALVRAARDGRIVATPGT